MARAEGSGPDVIGGGPRLPRTPPPGRAAALAGLLLLALSSCVYFNTYYNAEKYFRQAEKARLEAERQPTASGPQRRTRTRRSQESYHSLYEKALRKASVVLEKHSESDLVDDAMFIAGRALYWQSDYFYAARSFRDLEIHFPESEYYHRARYWRGLCLDEQGIHAEARSVYRELFEEGAPGVGARAGFRLGELAAEEGEYVVAIEGYRAVLARYPSSEVRAEALLRLGEAHLALEDEAHQDLALAAFAAVVEADPNDRISYRARLNRGKVLYEQGRVAEALEVYTGLLVGSRFRAYEGETRLLLGQYYWDRHLLDEALGEYERVRDDFPQTAESAMALYWTGLLHLREHAERARAQEYLEEVPKEKRDSEASLLAQETLGTLNELDRLRGLIARADSLTATEAVADDGIAAGDSAAGSAPDSLAATEDSAAVSVADDSTEQGAPSDSARRVRRASPAQARPRRGRADPRDSLLDNLFSVAELYRDQLVLPDSAAYFYGQIIERFPGTPELPRALYSLAWIRLDMLEDSEGAGPVLQRLIDEYPETIHAQGARQLLGVAMAQTAERQAAEQFVRLEAAHSEGEETAPDLLEGLDALVAEYPETPTAARAAYLAAWTHENALGDTVEAERRYAEVRERFPSSQYAELVRRRQEVVAQGVVAKLERSLRAMGEGVKPGERLVVIAVEPDSADSASLARKSLGFALRAHRSGRLQAAEALYESVLEHRPRESRALYGIGDIRWQAGYYEDAVDYLRRAVREGASSRDTIGPLGAYYRLFAYFVRSDQADSSNHYLRQALRRDRDNPEIASLQDEFPKLLSAEPEDVDMSVLEELEVVPPERLLYEPVRGLGLGEPPLVRTSVRPQYPEGAGGDSAVVVLEILIDEDGLPQSVAVFEGDEPFAGAAEEAARRYVFYAGEDPRGRSLRVWVELEIPVGPPSAPATSETVTEVATGPTEDPEHPPDTEEEP